MKAKQNKEIAVQVNLTVDDYITINQRFKNLGLSDSGGFQFLAKRFGSQLDLDINPIVINRDTRKVPAKCQQLPGRVHNRMILRQ